MLNWQLFEHWLYQKGLFWFSFCEFVAVCNSNIVSYVVVNIQVGYQKPKIGFATIADFSVIKTRVIGSGINSFDYSLRWELVKINHQDRCRYWKREIRPQKAYFPCRLQIFPSIFPFSTMYYRSPSLILTKFP